MLAVAGLLLMGFAAQAGAASNETGLGLRGIGVRAGVSTEPDQFFVGGQLDLGEFVKNLRFKPNVTAGFGDDMTLISLNPDISYAFPIEDLGKLYVGGLLAFEYWKIDVPEDVEALEEITGVEIDDSDTDVGIHAIGGLELQSVPVFFEINIGLSDEVPDLKAAVGYNFPF